MLAASFTSLLVLAAGIAVLAMAVTLLVHDALRRFHNDILALDTVFARAFGSMERAHHGALGFFVFAWALVIALFILEQLPSFQAVTDGNALLAASLFGAGLYLVLMLVFLPVFRFGAFGRKHHEHVPYWGAFFVAVFVTAVSVLLSLVL